MKRRLALPALVALAALVPAAASHAASTHFKTGVSDQVAESFSSPYYNTLGLSTARYITPYDVMTLPPGDYTRTRTEAWMAAAHAAGQDVLVAFEASHTRGHERHIPNANEYTKDVKLFLRAHSYIHSVSAWNEANRCQRTSGGGAVIGQPICHKPKQAALYYKQMIKACAALKRTCNIVALDVLDQNNVKPTLAYIKTFLKSAKPFPKIWGFHNYSDTNRFSTKRSEAMLKATKRGQVWLTETGGIVRFGKSFPGGTVGETRAAKALGCMFKIADSDRRIKRLYIYNFAPGGPDNDFDAGLIGLDGKPRPGWLVVKQRKPGPCHK